MAEENKEEFAFIKEKIIKKPVNKKRLLKQGISTIDCRQWHVLYLP